MIINEVVSIANFALEGFKKATYLDFEYKNVESGANLEGNTANFSETEQLLEYDGFKSSFLEVNVLTNRWYSSNIYPAFNGQIRLVNLPAPFILAWDEQKRAYGLVLVLQYGEDVADAVKVTLGEHADYGYPLPVQTVKPKGGARVAFEDEFRAAEEREVSCEAQQGRSGVKRKLYGSCRNNMGNEPILALSEGSDSFVVMRGARFRMRA
nr:probable 6-phosphogluconolactonase 4, chloroplastic [Tanacetum cinerariifolium]